ncbi:unnamed protein product, partial [Ranitomeya imitator]
MKKIRAEGVPVILVAPDWPRRAWYAELVQLVANIPWRLPDRMDLLTGPDLTPELRGRVFDGVAVESWIVAQAGFSPEVSSTMISAWKPVSMRIYDRTWQHNAHGPVSPNDWLGEKDFTMCVASEAVKIEISGNINPAQLKALNVEETDEDEVVICNSQKECSTVCKEEGLSNVTIKTHGSPSTEHVDAHFVGFLKRDKIKKKTKKNKKTDHDAADKGSPKKSCKKRQSSESDIESVMYTIEAVAKGDWSVETPSSSPCKKVRSAASPKHDFSEVKPTKKKVKSKEKKEKATESTKELMEPEAAIILRHATESELQEDIKDEPLSPTEDVLQSPLPEMPKSEDCDGNKKSESCGSRKSERSCKGALYKTLVSEGMLTTLRANVDRGKRNLGKGGSSDHEGSWNDDTWTISQNGSKKLKKTKPKDDGNV